MFQVPSWDGIDEKQDKLADQLLADFPQSSVSGSVSIETGVPKNSSRPMTEDIAIPQDLISGTVESKTLKRKKKKKKETTNPKDEKEQVHDLPVGQHCVDQVANSNTTLTKEVRVDPYTVNNSNTKKKRKKEERNEAPLTLRADKEITNSVSTSDATILSNGKKKKKHAVKEIPVSKQDLKDDKYHQPGKTEPVLKNEPAKQAKSSCKALPSKYTDKLKKKLDGAQFRWINEQLYTTESNKAYKIFQGNMSLFDVYHRGFQSQVQSWPENPVDIIIQQVKRR